MSKPCNILVIDDDEDDFFIIKDFLQLLGPNLFELEWAPNFDIGYQLMLEKRHQIYLIDNLLGSGTGLELIKKASGIAAPKILLTGMGNRDLDIIAIRSGADDYLPKSQLTTETLERTIRHALERFEQRATIVREKRKFETLFDQSTDPIFITSNDRKLVDANPSFCQLFEIEPAQLENLTLREIFNDQEDYNHFVTESEVQRFSSTTSIQLKSLHGQFIDALISSSPLFGVEQDEPVAYQGTIHDISRLKKIEAELQLMEKINLTGRMIRTIAHDIRNPLTNITLASEQLRNDIGPGNEDAQLYTDIINRNSARINQLISSLLNNTRSTQPDLELLPVEIVVLDAIETCADRIQLKNIKLATIGLDGQTKAHIDKDKLKTAIANILTNAIEAMEATKLPVLTITSSKKKEVVVVTITDNGKGMTSDTLSHLFDPFYTNRPGGMGLGMTAVQQIVQQHDGSITVQSSPGKGSSFEIQLPIKSL